jgi:hypothetical protein
MERVNLGVISIVYFIVVLTVNGTGSSGESIGVAMRFALF